MKFPGTPFFQRKATLSILCVAALCPHGVQAFCFEEAAKRYSVEPELLAAVAQHESRLQPNTVVKNTNGSFDIGLMGINTVHLTELAKFGITPDALLNPCQNVMVGAYLLRKKINLHGYNWQAVGSYHSETPASNQTYQKLVYDKWQSINAVVGKPK